MEYPSIESMEHVTVAQLFAQFDDYFERVIAGAFLLIVEEGRPSCVLMPYDENINIP